MIFLELFWAFFKVGLFSFGGGYAAMPLISNQVVDMHSWLTMSEFGDIITISQMTPGPIGINCATFTGVKVAGILGGLVSTVSCILPSVIIVSILAVIYKKYKHLSVIQGVLKTLRPAVVALIASAGVSILLMVFFGSDSSPLNWADFQIIPAILTVICFLVLRIFKVNPIYVMIISGIVGGSAFYCLGI